MTLIKRIVYGHISKKCRVQKDKSTVWMDKLDNQFIYDFLEELDFLLPFPHVSKNWIKFWR